MNCDELLRQITDHAEGALDTELCALIERHLEQCQPCADLQHDLQDLRRLCAQSEPPPLPDALRERVKRLLEKA